MSSDLGIVGLLCDYDWQLGSRWVSFSEYFCMVMLFHSATNTDTPIAQLVVFIQSQLQYPQEVQKGV